MSSRTRAIERLSNQLSKTLLVLEKGADLVTTGKGSLDEFQKLRYDEKLIELTTKNNKASLVKKLFIDQYLGKKLSLDKTFIKAIPNGNVEKLSLKPLYDYEDLLEGVITELSTSQTNEYKTRAGELIRKTQHYICDTIFSIQAFCRIYGECRELDKERNSYSINKNICGRSMLLHKDIMARTFNEPYRGPTYSRTASLKLAISLLQGSSIVLVLKNNDPSFSDLQWNELQKKLEDINVEILSKSKKKKLVSIISLENEEEPNYKEFLQKYNNTLSESQYKFVKTRKMDELLWLYAFKLASLPGLDMRRLYNLKEVENILNSKDFGVECPENKEDFLFSLMLNEFGHSMNETMTKITSTLEQEESEKTTPSSNIDFNDIYLSESKLALLKSLMKKYYVIAINFDNLPDPVKELGYISNLPTDDIINLVKQKKDQQIKDALKKTFQTLNEYMVHEKTFSIVAAQLNYLKVPKFGSEMDQALETRKANTSDFGYEYFLQIARQNRRKREGVAAAAAAASKASEGGSECKPEETTPGAPLLVYQELLFDEILKELANNNLTAIVKSVSGDKLYFHS